MLKILRFTFVIFLGLTPFDPVFIGDSSAEYSFQKILDGQVITFPVEFVKENGVWKILEF